MTIQDLLKRVARGELSSCGGIGHEDSINIDSLHDGDMVKRNARLNSVDDDDDDEYYYDDIPDIFGDSTDNSENIDLNNHSETYTETPAGVADIMDQLGDADIVICDNLERALYLSLKYEFVTPLTSLVVVKPDSEDYGEFGEAGLRQRQHAGSFNIAYGKSEKLATSSPLIMLFFCAYLLL